MIFGINNSIANSGARIVGGCNGTLPPQNNGAASSNVHKLNFINSNDYDFLIITCYPSSDSYNPDSTGIISYNIQNIDNIIFKNTNNNAMMGYYKNVYSSSGKIQFVPITYNLNTSTNEITLTATPNKYDDPGPFTCIAYKY